uniref:DNA-binding protein S1FA n=5 Tax=Triticinae TaxID=1648030 RepID=A5WYH4_WHEAT|nr:DNA-binding protein S1FA [Triticum aestivum]
MAEKFAESANNVIIEEVNKGLNPGMIVLLVVATTLLLFFVGNYALYLYAQKTLPPKKKKPVSKKKLKREKLKQGVSAPGESRDPSISRVDCFMLGSSLPDKKYIPAGAAVLSYCLCRNLVLSGTSSVLDTLFKRTDKP